MSRQGFYINKSPKGTILAPESLSPDPTLLQGGRVDEKGNTVMTMYPYQLLRAEPYEAHYEALSQRMDGFSPWERLRLRPSGQGRRFLLLDFGAELDGALLLRIRTASAVNVMVRFGESPPEAMGEVFSAYPVPVRHWFAPAGGVHAHTCERRGFRYVGITVNDAAGDVWLEMVAADCVFPFSGYAGSFSCDDRRLQRLWYTSAYTARLCTREDSIWDGVKRDRIGWFGDARVTKETSDNVFYNPVPAEALMETLPTDRWVNGVVNYSFDAIGILKQHILFYGARRPCVERAYNLIRRFLDWVFASQTNADGFIIRTDQSFFYDIGFLDWSAMPVGGRFEELSWLQLRFLEGLKNAVFCAGVLGRAEDAALWQGWYDRLGPRVKKAFWREGRGFLHTLNHVGAVPNPHLPGYDGHYQKTYIHNIKMGPSGPSRQANALGVLSGICSGEMKRTVLENVLDNGQVPGIITPYFAYFEQTARAMCGDGAGAVRGIRDFVGAMVEQEDASAIWEMYDDSVTDMRKYASHFDTNWMCPLSLCHGWGSGAIPIVARQLAGITVTGAGYGSVALSPAKAGISFALSVPTPHGPLEAEGDGRRVRYRVPGAIEARSKDPDGTEIEYR